MGAQGFHGRVRNGVGWVTLAVITRPSGQGLTGGPGSFGVWATRSGVPGPGAAFAPDGARGRPVLASGCLVELVFKHGWCSLLEGGEFCRAIRIG